MNSCPLCGSALDAVLLAITEPDRFERSAGIPSDGYLREWRECPGCGAAVNCLPSCSVEVWRSLATQYYEIDFSGRPLRERYDQVMALPPTRSDNAGRVARIRQYLSHFSPPPRALDIGAGLGVFLSAFLADDWKGLAFEPDPLAAAHLRSLEKFDVREGLFSGQEEIRDFGLVTLNKVVEHLREPRRLLRDAAGALDPLRGLLYVEVPDRETISLRPSTDNILGSAHAHLYSPESLGLLLVEAGLRPLRVERVVEPSGKITVFAFAMTPQGLHALAR